MFVQNLRPHEEDVCAKPGMQDVCAKLEIGLMCSMESPKDRPGMQSVETF
jgi:hypothetical protein